MAQRKKKLTKRKGRPGRREPEADSDSGGDVGLVTDNRGDEEENSCRKLPHFPAATDGCTSDVEPDTRQLVRCQNKKKKKSGGFQSMGLSYPVYKGVMKKGYKVPTPIQRKTVPVILDGKDIVAMARTGSGKTAAFLIPMFEKLKGPNAQTGARALILTPTRELALQTMKFTKEVPGLCTNPFLLDVFSMDDQFAALHENPDIIIGTPGRLMHVIQQMNLKLQSVEYVVFDEADRLFEMGFAEQLTEIIRRLPDNRQSLLFSATLPKLLVEFARAGLTEPVLIRLDVDTKLSDQLKLNFFHLRLDDKPALLLHLLRHVVKPQEQTVVFVATKHHVEYVKQLLTLEGVECAYIYSALDQTARKINIGKFVHRKAMVLIVTDVAARGIDIPLLDNVINYNFPSKAKLFLHRVGRVARAGRSGVSYSLVCPDEIPFVYDLHLFLGRPLQLATGSFCVLPDADGVFGRVPQCILDDEGAQLLAVHENSLDLSQIHHISENAYKQYLKSRPSPSPESIKRVKNTDLSTLAVHPLLGLCEKLFSPFQTIFEINSNSKTVACKVMRRKRSRDTRLVEKYSKKREDQVTESRLLHGVFSEVVGGKRRRPAQENEETEKPTLKRSKAGGKDEEFYIPYRPKDFDSERGLSLGSEGTMFDQQATSAVLDMMGDEGKALNQHKRIMKWDRKKKRFITDTGKEDQKKRVRLETGQVVSAKNKKNLYPAFSLLATLTSCCPFCLVVDVFTASRGRGRGRGGRGAPSRSPGGPQPGGQRVRSELKSSDEILKTRRKQQKQQFLQSGGLKRGRQGSGGGGHSGSFGGRGHSGGGGFGGRGGRGNKRGGRRM
uniref:RNA helicase n=1 Tax=Gadus morhua TaxID=8049 RepID=A0A8C5CXX0_GADMO